MPTAQKAQTIETLKGRLQGANAIYLVDYQGVNVEKITKLRRDFRDAGSELAVVKNTLTRIAAHQIGQDGLNDMLKGPTAIVICDDEVVGPAKVLNEFAKGNEKIFKIKGGLLEGQVISSDQIKQVADLPSREQLLGQFVGTLVSPVSGFVGVLNGVIRNFVGVLDAIAKEKEKSN